jgi:hypothetical protein
MLAPAPQPCRLCRHRRWSFVDRISFTREFMECGHPAAVTWLRAATGDRLARRPFCTMFRDDPSEADIALMDQRAAPDLAARHRRVAALLCGSQGKYFEPRGPWWRRLWRRG